jgi:hypothetical protein
MVQACSRASCGLGGLCLVGEEVCRVPLGEQEFAAQLGVWLCAGAHVAYCFRHLEEGVTVETKQTVSQGLSMGSALAMILSWQHNASIFWAIVHGVCSWFYVVWYAVSR